MGKREVGELSIFDLVVFFVISELLSISIENVNENPLKSIVPIAVMVILQKLTAYLVLKNKKARDFIDGREVFIIKDGIINQKVMRENRYNIDDLLLQLRQKDIDTPSKVRFAVLESDGSLSVIANDPCNVIYPNPVIKDGEIEQKALEDMNKTKAWLLSELKALGYKNTEDIFLCIVEKNGLYIVPKQLS
jgi:uncharacterized membrane protein YcaP (DUF421 family)